MISCFEVVYYWGERFSVSWSGGLMECRVIFYRNPNGLEGGRSWSWPARSALSKQYYEISIGSMSEPVIGSGPRTEHCAFWDNYLPNLLSGTGECASVAPFPPLPRYYPELCAIIE